MRYDYYVALAHYPDETMRNSEAPFDVATVSKALMGAAQRELIASAIHGRELTTSVTPDQRAIIRNLCSEPTLSAHPSEQLLVAFKTGLAEAANELRVPVGPDRNDLLSRLVSAFIEEFYGGRRGAADTSIASDASSATLPKSDLEQVREARA
ncbi:MAG TPA: hypothetical protein VE110_06905 [Gemmatimonadaceae bacterium]|nr:hypothetical protein [Gemmatimonadaceae bacterium]